MQDISLGTTQNVSLSIEKAGLGKRLLAFIIDYLVLIGVAILASYTIEFTNIDKVQYVWIIISIIFFFYHFIFEIFSEGQSVGKITQKIRVVKSTGEGANIYQYFIRALIRPIDSMAGLGLIFMIFSSKGQRLGDIAANTIVIKLDDAVEFKDTALVDVEEEYKPMMSRSEIEKLSSANIELIKQIIEETEKTKDYSLVGELHSKIVEITGNNNDSRLPFEYLKAVVKDYSYYN